VIGNAIDDPINTLRVLETAHRPGPTADLSEGSLYSIGGANLAPVCSRAAQEIQEFIQVCLQATYSLRLARAPFVGPLPKAGYCLSTGGGLINLFSPFEARLLDLPGQLSGYIPQLMHPASLSGHIGIDHIQCSK